MSCPIGWGSPPENVLQVHSRTAFDEQADYFLMAAMSVHPSVLWPLAGVSKVYEDLVRNVRTGHTHTELGLDQEGGLLRELLQAELN